MSNDVSGNFPTLTYRNLSLGVTGQVIKAFKGQVFELTLINNAAALRYVKLYDKATAATSSDTPIRTYVLLANSVLCVALPDAGVQFLAGIGARGCNGLADNDNTAPTANDIVVNISYL